MSSRFHWSLFILQFKVSTVVILGKLLKTVFEISFAATTKGMNNRVFTVQI